MARGQAMTSYGSLFTGVGGFDLGCDAAGWECAFQVEWDKKAASVLEHHWPEVPKWSDVSDVKGADLPPVYVITFGFPCQDLSVAGKRAGLDGERSGLFFEAMRIIKEMREATRGKYPRVIIAENVTGLLNADGGTAMGRCLDEMAASGALEIEWRVLDAQHFGVPQRRRRVFIVARFDNGNGSSEPIFSQPESSSRSVASGNETRQDTTTSASSSPRDSGEHLIPIAFSHTAGINCQPSTTTTTTTKGQSSQAVAFVKARRAKSVDDYETWEPDRPAPTLNAFDNAHETRATVLAFAINQRAEVRDVGDISTALQASPGTNCQTFLAIPQIVGTVTTAFGPKNYSNMQEVLSGAIQATTTGSVRRLTPRECERLQGWPDDHTRWDADGKENSDGSRYKMIGNGVAAPVAQWIAERIEQAL